MKTKFGNKRQKSRKHTSSTVRRHRPRFEQLEPRTLLASIAWINPAGGSWNSAANWDLGRVPAAGDDVVIPDLPGSATITYSASTTAVQSITSAEKLSVTGGTLSVVTSVSGAGSLSLAGGALAGGAFNQSVALTNVGGTLDGVTINGALDVTAYGGWANVQNGLTLNGVATIGEYARLYFAGTQTLGGSGTVVFQDWYANALVASTNGMTLTIGAGITIRGGGDGSYSARIGGNGYWTSAANASIVNQGTITADAAGMSIYVYPKGTGTFTNTGTVSTAGGNLFVGGNYTRAQLGTLHRNGGNFYVAGNLDLTGTTENLAGANQSWHLGGGAIKGGTINATGGAKVIATNSGGTLDGATLHGDLDVTTYNSWANVQNGLTLNGTATLGEYARLYFQGTQALGGTGTVVFQDWYANALVASTNGMTLTIGPGITIRGGGDSSYSARIGGNAYWTSATNASIVNQGTITADAVGLALHIYPEGSGTFTNTGTLTTAGGDLVVGGNYTRAGLGTLNRIGGNFYVAGALDLIGATEHLAGANQSWHLGGGTIKGGTINATGGAKLIVSDWGGTLDGLTLNGDLDGTIYSSRATVQNGLTLNGTATLGEYARLYFAGTQTLGGTGTVVFQDWYANALVTSTNGMTLTIGPGITIRGGGDGSYSARIGGNGYWSSATNASIVNQGTITADAVGMSIYVHPMGTGTFSNVGTLNTDGGNLVVGGAYTRAALGTLNRNGGEFYVAGALDLTGVTENLNGTNESWHLGGGTIKGGVINATGGAKLILSDRGGTLDGLTLNGDLDLTTQDSRANVQNGLILNGTATLGEYARLYFVGTQTLAGTGTVLFQDRYANGFVTSTNGMTLTIGPGIAIRGGGNRSYSARIGGNGYWSSAANASIVNQGTITADAVGMSLNFYPKGSGTFTNLGTLNTEGGNLVIGGNYTRAALGTLNRNGGSFYVAGNLDLTGVTENWNGANQSWHLGGGTIKGGTINAAAGAKLHGTDAGGAFDGVTLNGDLDLTIRNAWANVHNGLTLHGTATLGEYARLYFVDTQTLSGTGTVLFQDWYANALVTSTNGMTLTVGPSMTIRGGGDGSYSARIGGDGYWPSAANASIVNQGTITADAAGMSLYVYPMGTGSFSNTGTLNTAGGNLFIGGNYTRAELGTLNRNGGDLYIAGELDLMGGVEDLSGANQSWRLGNGVIKNGVVNVTNGAKLYATDWGGALDGVTLNGDLDLTERQSWVNIHNGLTLNGTATLGDFARLYFIESQTLAGNGTVVFQNWSANALVTATNGMTLTIGPGMTIRGGGLASYSVTSVIGSSGYWSGGNNTSIVNQGVISVDTAGRSINVNPRGTGTFRNTGVLDINSGKLSIAGDATIEAGSILRMSNSGVLAAAGSLDMQIPFPSVSNLKGFVRLEGPGGGLGSGDPPVRSLEAVSVDLGSGLAGYTNNTVLGSLIVTDNNDVKLVDLVDNSPGATPEALYTNSLVVSANSSLDLNGLKLYTRSAQVDGSILGGSIFQLPDSGALTVGLITPGKIAVAGELDEWNFFGRAGRTIALTVNPGSLASEGAPPAISPQLAYVNVSVVAPDDTVLASANATSNGQVLSLSNIVLPTDGNYRIRVRAATGQSSRTGNYNLGVYDVTVDEARLLLNRPTVGQLTPSFNTDHWRFSVAEGRQIRFDLLGSTASGLKFTLQGPAGYVPFTDLDGDSELNTIPAGRGGEYTLKVQASADQTASYSFAVRETTVTDLAVNTTLAGTLAGAADAQLFKITTTASKPLFVQLDDATNGNRNQVYMKFGAPPTRADYDFRHDGGPTADPQLLSTNAAAGDWYVLVYGDFVPAASGFTLRAVSSDVHISGVTPDQHGANAAVPLTLTGAGFVAGTQVKLIGPGTQEFFPTAWSIDSFSQISASFDLSGAAPGAYAVEVRNPSGDSDTRVNALTVTPPGEAKLETRTIMPQGLGRHAVATIYLEYANTGSASMPAPLLILQSADEDNSDRPILTLDQSRIVQNFWSEGLPPETSNSVLILGSGAQPGVLNPGERIQVPVYYLGLQRPWDFSDSQMEFQVGYWTADDTNPVEWEETKESLRPSTLTASQWDAIFGNLTDDIGTMGQYVQMLSDNAVYLSKLGQNITDVDDLWTFEVQQAAGLSAVDNLDVVVDAALPTPGLPLDFSRRFGSSLAARNAVGPFGQGWFTDWQTNLVAEGGGEVVLVRGQGGSARVFQRDSRNGKYFSSPGDSGELVAVAGEYELRELGGIVTRFQADGKLRYHRDANGNQITPNYDGTGRLVGIAHTSGASFTIDYNPAGLVSSVTDSAGRTTTYEYDPTNTWLTTVTSAGDQITRYTYQTSGSPAVKHALLSAEYNGATRHFTYDSRGRLDSSYRTGNAYFVDYGYDTTGRVTVGDHLGVSTLFFDHRGLLAKTTDALGNTAVSEFDDNLNVTRITAPTGESQSFTWTQRGQLTSMTNELAQKTTYAYATPTNNLTEFIDAKGNKTLFTYDAKGNPLTTVYPNGSVEALSNYSSAGLPAQYTNRRGQTLSYSYNAAGQVTKLTYVDGSVIDFEYDARGNLTQAIDGAETTTYTYTAADRLDRVAYPNGRYLDYNYDAFGRRILMTDQDGLATKYEYDVAGRLHQLKDGDDNIVVTYTYDAAGRLSRIDKGNGTFTTYEYDAAGQLTSLKNWRAVGLLNSKFDYTYDTRGRRTSMTTVEGAWTYAYDGASQLTRALFVSASPATIPNQDLQYVYDAAGNRLRTIENGVTTEYNANNLNQYTSVGGVAHTYDADGNLTFDGTNTYTYDQLGRLIRAVGPAGITEHEYDAAGDRIATTIDGARTEFLIDPLNPVGAANHYGPTGNLLNRYISGIGIAARIDLASNFQFYDYDAQGSAVGLTAGAGTILNQYAYDPFGGSLLSNETVANTAQFLGQWGPMTFSGQALVNTAARAYSPALGRFIGVDRLGLGGGQTNLYAYALNNPVDYLDASGRSPTLITGGVGAVIGGAVGGIVYGAQWAITGEGSARGLGGATIGGAVSGGVFGLTAGMSGVAAVGVGMAGAGAGATVGHVVEYAGTSEFATVDAAAKIGISTILGAIPIPAMKWADFRGKWGAGAPGFIKTLLGQNKHGRVMWINSSVGALIEVFVQATIAERLAKTIATAIDPNDKFGADGFGPQGYITGDTPISYRIRFENLGPGSKDHDGNPYPVAATAPAQRVTITDQLSTDLDWNTFQITELGWGDIVVSVPPGSSYFAGVQSMTYNGKTFDVELEAGIDLATGRVFVTFQSIDPEWGLPPDILTGFLPPEDGTGRGMGHVLFTIRPRIGLPDGTELRNIALISFDDQLLIATNQVDPLNPGLGTDPAREALNTIDAGPPNSSVTSLPANLGNASIPVVWSGSDGAGSGIAAYDIFVRIDDGDWTLWLDNTTETSANYAGALGSTYAFYSVAIDNVGFAEEAPSVPDTSTTIVENAWHNFALAEDVDGNDDVNIQDAIDIIRDLRRSGSRNVTGASTSGLYLDVTNDNRVDIHDAIEVIRYLRRNRLGTGGEGESTSDSSKGRIIAAHGSGANLEDFLELISFDIAANKKRRSAQ